MPHRMHWRLATTRDLIAFHATRSDSYRIVGDLIRARLTPAQLVHLLPLVAHMAARHPQFPALATLRGALAQVERECGAEGGPVPSPDWDRCEGHAEAARGALIRAARVTSSEGRHAELRAMAVLAEGTGHALARSAPDAAAATSAAQADFLRAHGAACFSGLVAQLARSDEPLFRAAGHLLDAILSGDLEDLESQPSGS